MADHNANDTTMAQDSDSDEDRHVPERDGSTPELAILEDQWVWRRRHCPGFTQAMQMLMSRDGKYFDQLTLESGDEVRVVYFDVSALGWLEHFRAIAEREGESRARSQISAARTVAQMDAQVPADQTARYLAALDQVEREMFPNPS